MTWTSPPRRRGTSGSRTGGCCPTRGSPRPSPSRRPPHSREGAGKEGRRGVTRPHNHRLASHGPPPADLPCRPDGPDRGRPGRGRRLHGPEVASDHQAEQRPSARQLLARPVREPQGLHDLDLERACDQRRRAYDGEVPELVRLHARGARRPAAHRRRPALLDPDHRRRRMQVVHALRLQRRADIRAGRHLLPRVECQPALHPPLDPGRRSVLLREGHHDLADLSPSARSGRLVMMPSIRLSARKRSICPWSSTVQTQTGFLAAARAASVAYRWSRVMKSIGLTRTSGKPALTAFTEDSKSGVTTTRSAAHLSSTLPTSSSS